MHKWTMAGRVYTYLVWEAFHQNGHQEIEEDVVTEGHQGHKVQSSPVTGALHAKEEHDIPILLCQDLCTKMSHNFAVM